VFLVEVDVKHIGFVQQIHKDTSVSLLDIVLNEAVELAQALVRDKYILSGCIELHKSRYGSPHLLPGLLRVSPFLVHEGLPIVALEDRPVPLDALQRVDV